MVRAQVQFTEEQMEALRQISRQQRRSISAIVRDAVATAITTNRTRPETDRVRRALDVAGKFSSGLTDVSARHDDYLADAFCFDKHFAEQGFRVLP